MCKPALWAMLEAWPACSSYDLGSVDFSAKAPAGMCSWDPKQSELAQMIVAPAVSATMSFVRAWRGLFCIRWPACYGTKA